jgi:hypothetical protein
MTTNLDRRQAGPVPARDAACDQAFIRVQLTQADISLTKKESESQS